MKTPFLLLTALFLTAPLMGLETWPRFRGENGSGLSAAKLPTSIGKEVLRWSVPLVGTGSSSPVIWGEALFVTGEDREKGTVSLMCLDAKTGKAGWSKSLAVGDYHMHRFNNTAASTPVVNADVVVVSWFDGGKKVAMLSGFDHAGKRLWDYTVGGFKGAHGPNMNVELHEGRVIFGHLNQEASYLAALDAKSGQEIWKTVCPRDRASYITPLVRNLPEGGKEVIISSQGMGVAGFDFSTGKQRWVIPKIMKQRTVVSPIHILASDSDDSLIGVGCKSGVYLAVRPPQMVEGKMTEPTVVWRMKGNTPYVPTPISDGKAVYAISDGGVLTAMNSRSGEKMWQQRMKGNFYASPLIIDGRLYCLTREGEMIVAEVGKEYKELSRNGLELGPEGGLADSTPAVAHGCLYVRIGARLDCYGKK